MSDFTPEQKSILAKYVTDPDGRVFCAVNLPGIAGPIFARYSRARTGFRETLINEFIDEKGEINVGKADDLIERVLVAYGDDSVGELEGAHLALEQVSNLATKVVEDVRIGGSPIEQSTRYVFYDQKAADGKFKYFRDPRIMAHPGLGPLYEKTMDGFFEVYCSLVEPMMGFLGGLMPVNEFAVDLRGTGTKVKLSDLSGEKDAKDFRRTYRETLRTKACDTIRVVLPAATLTNVGVYGNGRYFHTLLDRLYSHPLSEMSDLARLAKGALDTVIPKFVKRAKRNEHAVQCEQATQRLADELFNNVPVNDSPPVLLLDSQFSDANVAAAMLYRFVNHPMHQVQEVVAGLPAEKRLEIIETYAGDRKSRRDRSGRALEFGYPLTFDLLGDFGIYRDLQRHRMVTQERQRLMPHHGFWMPDLIVEARLDDRVKVCRDKSAVLYELIRRELGRDEAQYAVLFGFNIRWTMGMNAREAQHMWELRTGPQGHPNYRRMCQEMDRCALERFPWMRSVTGFVNKEDIFWSRAESEAAQRRKERKLGGAL